MVNIIHLNTLLGIMIMMLLDHYINKFNENENKNKNKNTITMSLKVKGKKPSKITIKYEKKLKTS